MKIKLLNELAKKCADESNDTEKFIPLTLDTLKSLVNFANHKLNAHRRRQIVRCSRHVELAIPELSCRMAKSCL